jgi:hypothetical protein
MPDLPLPPRFHLLACSAYALLCVAFTAWAGRDQNWDLLNYHLYVAEAWWEGRLPGEWFAASAQGYLNPLPHLPFYALFSTGWHSLVIGTILALIHGANLGLLHAIATRLIPASVPYRRTFIVGGVLLGGLSPAFLLETGTSFVDVIVSLPALGALLCVLTWTQGSGYRLLWAGFALAGLAIGLKPTTAVFGVSLGLATLLTHGRTWFAISWRAAIATCVGALATGSAQAWSLWKAFGNPVFPMFNQYFRSPYFVPESVVSDRFRPASLVDALRYPLDLANAFRLPGLEGISVDIRPIALLCLFLAAVAWLRPRKDGVLFGITLGLFCTLWLLSSGNTRYAIEGFLLIGPAIALIAARLPDSCRKPALVAIALLCVAQATLALTLNMVRFGGSGASTWKRDWLSVEVPESLRRQPAYYLSLQIQSHSMLVHFLPQGSRLTNLVGQFTLDPDGVVWHRVVQDRDTRHLPWRSLYAIPGTDQDGALPPQTLDHQDALLSTYGLRTDRSDCQFIDLNGEGRPPLHWSPAGTPLKASASGRAAIVTCALQAATPLSVDEQQRRIALDARMRAWELRCPSVFSPRAFSEQSVLSRSRFYAKSDTNLTAMNSGGLYLRKGSLGLSIPLEDRTGKALVTDCLDMHLANQDGGRSR